MYKFTTFLCLILMAFFGISHTRCFAASDIQSYQNFNHGYCPSCDCAPCCGTGTCAPCEETYCAPCEASCDTACDDPCAPVCGAQCGISICAIGIGIAAVVAAAAIIIASGNGSSSH